jgi:hypothetical protein
MEEVLHRRNDDLEWEESPGLSSHSIVIDIFPTGPMGVDEA